MLSKEQREALEVALDHLAVASGPVTLGAVCVIQELLAASAAPAEGREAVDERAAFEEAFRRNFEFPEKADQHTFRKGWDAGLMEARAALATAPTKSIPMLLFCPKCGKQHIDAPEEHDVVIGSGEHRVAVDTIVSWENPPHRSHLCHACGTIWRPADMPTNGVAEIKTRGKADNWSGTATAPTMSEVVRVLTVADIREIAENVRDEHGNRTWGQGVWPKNVWLGATICNQQEADRDIPKLLAVPARVRFLSMEPLLGPVNLRRLRLSQQDWFLDAFTGRQYTGTVEDIDEVGHAGIDWVIVGGESGCGARPMHPDWARSLRDQCAAAGVPFLFKQWGEWTDEDWGERAGLRDTAGVLPSGEFVLMSEGYVPPFDDGARLAAAGNVRLDGRMLMDRVGKRAAGRLLDGRTHDEFPEVAR